MHIVAIAVVGSNGVIGDGHDQPFKIKADWARFKRTTTGHCMVMGRKTFAAMGLLPGRTSIVVSRSPERVELPDPADGAEVFVVGSLESAFDLAESLGEEICFVTGGGELYHQALDFCDELDLTEVHAPAPGNVVFPAVDPAVWREAARAKHRDHEPAFDFVTYVRA